MGQQLPPITATPHLKPLMQFFEIHGSVKRLTDKVNNNSLSNISQPSQ